MSKAGEHCRKCVPLCPKILALEDTHNISVMCLGQKLVCSVLEASEYAHCECYPMRSSIRVCTSSREMSDKHLYLAVRVPLMPRHGEDSDLFGLSDPADLCSTLVPTWCSSLFGF